MALILCKLCKTLRVVIVSLLLAASLKCVDKKLQKLRKLNAMKATQKLTDPAEIERTAVQRICSRCCTKY